MRRCYHSARLAIAISLAGCAGDDATGPAPDGFALSVGPATIGVLAGSTNAAQLTMTRLNGFAGVIELSAENVPAGLDVVLPPAVSVSRPTVPIHVVAQFGVAGPKTFIVRAKAEGRADDTVQVNVTVVGEAAHRYTLQLSLAEITIQRGLTTSVRLAISRSPGFGEAVPFECTNVPEGVHLYPTTAAGDYNNPVAGFETTVLISVSPAVYPTTYFLKCYGLVPDVAVEDVDLRLVVVPPPLLPGRPAERKQD